MSAKITQISRRHVVDIARVIELRLAATLGLSASELRSILVNERVSEPAIRPQVTQCVIASWAQE
jgi:hypothetical protein